MPGPFYFDQSSAHAALAPDALEAFDMNKSNGGVQQRQKDTIIPESNPFPEYCGRVQKMMMESGRKKGSSKLSKSTASMWVTFMPNAHPSVRLRTMMHGMHSQ